MCWKGNKVDRLKTTTGGETNKQPKIGRLQAWKGAHDRAYSRIAHGPACTPVQTSPPSLACTPVQTSRHCNTSKKKGRDRNKLGLAEG